MSNDPDFIPYEPPCDTCRVYLAEENADAFNIYQITKDQVIMRFNGQYDVPIALNHIALWKNIEKNKIKDGLKCFAAVNTIFYRFLEKDKDGAS